MAMFYAAIRRDSVSLRRFPFLSCVQAFWCEISLVSRLKYPYSCFSSHFCFLALVVQFIILLFILFLDAIIGLVVFESSYWCIDTIFNAVESSSSFFLFFFDIFYLSPSSLGCKALCIVISFLVLWSICWHPSFLHFKNGPENRTKETAQVFIPLMRYRLYILVSSSFFFFRSPEILFFLIFLSSPLVWWCLLPLFPNTCNFPFLWEFWF